MLSVFPAPAGINRRLERGTIQNQRVPRASGDKPNFLHCLNRLHNVFPAPAGINRMPLLNAPPFCRVPRASGDKPGALDAMMDIT